VYDSIQVEQVNAESLSFRELREGSARRGDELGGVPGAPRCVRELQRDDLTAGNVTADHEVDDPHLSILAAVVNPPVARVAFSHSILFYGSTEGYLRELFERLPARGFEVWLAAPDEPVLEPLLSLPALEGRIVRFPLPHSFPAWVRAYRHAFRRIRPDIVHCGDVDPPAMLAARLAGVGRLVVTHHTPELRRSDNALGRALRRLGWAMRPHVVYTSELDRETSLARDPVQPRRASAISLGIDLERFAPKTDGRLRTELALGTDVPIVGTVGRLHAQKGHADLIAAAADLERAGREAAYVVVGDGALRERLGDQVREAGLEGRFHFLGHRDDVPELLAGFDVFVLPSHFEGMCLAVAEALAVERPVVATDVGGVRQSVVPGETGVLVEPGRPEELARQIAWVLDHPDEARRMASAGRERVHRLYALDAMTDATADLYRRLLR
jgi:glycosyltransferase involved in cell wall biosynthesis